MRDIKKLAHTLTEQSAAAIEEKNRINRLIRDIYDATYRDPALSPKDNKKADILIESIRNSPDANLLDEQTGFDDAMSSEIEAIETRAAAIRSIWETCAKQAITSKVLLLTVTSLRSVFQNSLELQYKLFEYSTAVEKARGITTLYELTNFRQSFYTWHEQTHFTKIAPLHFAFDLFDNIDGCLLPKARKTHLSDRFKDLLELHAPMMPTSLNPDPLLVLIYKMTKAFNELEFVYPDIKKALKLKQRKKSNVIADGESQTNATESSTSKITSVLKPDNSVKNHRRRASSISATDDTIKPETSAPRIIDPRMQRMNTVSKLTTHYRPKHLQSVSSLSLSSVLQENSSDDALDMEKVRRLSSSAKK